MKEDATQINKLLRTLETTWTSFQASYARLSATEMQAPGVTDDWSVKDILAHVTTWEEEALKHLPAIIAGGRPPRYITFGGLDAFNAQMTAKKRSLSLGEILRQLEATHRRLIAFVRAAPADQFAADTRARRRLRLDTYSHYPIHTRTIREWRERRAGE